MVPDGAQAPTRSGNSEVNSQDNTRTRDRVYATNDVQRNVCPSPRSRARPCPLCAVVIIRDAPRRRLHRQHYFRANLKRFLSLFPRPFSRSSGRRGVGGTSSKRILAREPSARLDSLTDLGNSLRRGVSAVTTFFADFRMDSRIFHSLFLAT